MKVLHLLKTSVGASWALRQTRQLVLLGIDVHIVLPDGPMVEKYRHNGCHVHVFDPSVRFQQPIESWRRARRLRKLVEEIQPDLVHSHFVATTLLMRLALAGYPVAKVFHVPGPLHLEHCLFRALDLYSAGKNDYWLASCKWTLQKYASCGVEAERLGLAYYGVDESDFHFSAAAYCQLQSLLGVPQDTFMIGMVAYFYAPKRYLGQTRGLKGHEDLIDAIALVKERHAGVHVVFVGGAWDGADNYLEQVKAYAENNAPGLCSFLGYRSDVPQLYPQFDLAVHPSHSENVGGAVESMYAGVATITSDVGGFPDLVTDGVTGFMCRAKDPAHLADKICQAIEHPGLRQQCVSNARIKVAEVMNVAENAKQIVAFYQQVLSHQAGGEVSSEKTL